jgi:hypothetical protein
MLQSFLRIRLRSLMEELLAYSIGQSKSHDQLRLKGLCSGMGVIVVVIFATD